MEISKQEEWVEQDNSKKMEISRDKKSEWNKKTVKQIGISRQEEWVEQEDSETEGNKYTRRVSGTRRQWNRWK